MLNVIDEFTRKCIAIRVERKLKAIDVIDVLSDLFILHGVPTHIRSDNARSSSPRGATGVDRAVGAKTAYIMPGSPWENGYCESLTRSSVMNCSTARSSTRSRRRKSSSETGDSIIIP